MHFLFYIDNLVGPIAEGRGLGEGQCPHIFREARNDPGLV